MSKQTAPHALLHSDLMLVMKELEENLIMNVTIEKLILIAIQVFYISVLSTVALEILHTVSV